jgi:exodeoxyribonuclease VIII
MEEGHVRDDMPAEEYHAHEAVSKSKADTFRQSRKRYYRRFVEGSLAAKPPTPQMKAGTVLHALLLEPDTFDCLFCVAPKIYRRTKQGKADWAAFQRASEGMTIVEDATMSAAARMAEAVEASDMAMSLLSNPEAKFEQSIFWHDGQSALDLKARLDVVHPQCLIDVKTARDASPEGFAKACASFGYHRQHEWYQRGWEAITGEKLPFVFLVVANDEPHEVALYTLDNAAVQLGADQNRTTLSQLKTSIQTDSWASPWEASINELSLPRYAAYADEFEVYV